MKIIVYKDWENLTLELGGELWESGMSLPTKPYVFSTAEHIDNLFRDILENQNYTHQFILISGASDAGLMYQNQVNPVRDIQNWVLMDEAIEQHMPYHDYISRSRHEKKRCLYRDKFCFKMYTWMSSTFPCIPKQIKRWYTSNCNIEDKRVVPIPFGINPDSRKPINEIVQNIKSIKTERSNKVVACWSNSTNERARLQSVLDPNTFYTDKCTPDEFFYRLLTSKFCLCPEGNGWDSYRILEAIYCGCIPIIVTNLENPRWTKAYPELPYFRLNEIGSAITGMIQRGTTLGSFAMGDSIYLDYWKERIQNE